MRPLPLLLAVALPLLSNPTVGQQRFDDGMSLDHLPPGSRGTTTSMAAVDLDGDGDLDLIVGRGQDEVWINDGHGHFHDATQDRMPAFVGTTRAIATGDIDGDGDADVLLAADGGQDRLLRNDGSGHLVDDTAALTTGALFTRAVGLVDVDGDGDLDAVLAQYGAFTTVPPVLLQNDGSGHFTDVSATALPATGMRAAVVVTRDLTGDGAPDLLLLGSPNVLLRNDGTGVFTVAGPLPALPLPITPPYAAAADVDGDGDVDVMISNVFDLVLWQNDGTGTFSDVSATRLPADPIAPLVMCLADLDGDGDRDLATWGSLPDRTSHLFLFANDGSGTFGPWSPSWDDRFAVQIQALVAADLDGDGDTDLVTGTWVGDRILVNDGTGTFTAAWQPRLPAADLDVDSAVAADFDGDGDVLVPGWRLCRNDGHGRFTATALSVTAAGNRLDAGDIDGDGDFDVLFDGAPTTAPGWLRNDGGGNFSMRALPAPAGPMSRVALLDVDRDGDLDVFLAYLGPQNRLLRNQGGGSFTDVTATALPVLDPEYTLDVVALDVDGDRAPDLVLTGYRNPFGGTPLLALWRNDGAGHFGDETATSLPAVTEYPTRLAAADFDGDGDVDLYFGKVGQDEVLWNDGSGVFAVAAPSPLPPDTDAPITLLCADLDRDGRPDLLIPHGDGARLLHNDGGGAFSSAPTGTPTLAGVRLLRAFDADGDDDLDLLSVHTDGLAAVHANRAVQCTVPWLALTGRPWRAEFGCRPGDVIAGCVAIPVVGAALAPTPIAVPSLGRFALDPAMLLDLQPWVPIDPATGSGTHAMVVPTDAAILGVPFFVQALIADPAGVHSHLTNAVGAVVLR
ncbi:MAG: FG-GAP repeat domain-containing protein [Planctomycetota bacterium]